LTLPELNFVSWLALESDHALGVFCIVTVEDRLAIENDHVVVAIGRDVVVVPLTPSTPALPTRGV
jgi:hypothetical protein